MKIYIYKITKNANGRGKEYFISNYGGEYIINKKGFKRKLENFEVEKFADSKNYSPYWVYIKGDEDPYFIVDREYGDKDFFDNLMKKFVIQAPEWQLVTNITYNDEKTSTKVEYKYSYWRKYMAFQDEEQYEKYLAFCDKNKIHEGKVVELPFYYESYYYFGKIYRNGDEEKWREFRNNDLIEHNLFSEFVKNEKVKPYIL